MKNITEEKIRECTWYSEATGECRILCELQCKERSKCTFCESQREYKERIKPYEELMNTYKEIFTKRAIECRWTSKKIKREWDKFSPLSKSKKEDYLSKME